MVWDGLGGPVITVVLAALLSSPPASAADAPTPPVHIERFGRGFVNPWVIFTPDQAVIIDTHYERAHAWLMRKLGKAGIDAHPIAAIIVTHGHSDHAGGVVALREATGAPVILGAGDVPMVEAGHNPPIHATSLLSAFIRPTIAQAFPRFTPDVVVTDRIDLAPYGLSGDIEVVGGHTLGSLVVRLTTGELFVGDLVRSHFLAHHRPTEHFFQPDKDDVHGVLRGALGDATIVYPGHGGSIDAVKVHRWLDRVEPDATAPSGTRTEP